MNSEASVLNPARILGPPVPCGKLASAFLFGALWCLPNTALADEGGVSFWIPGFFGSLAAAPLQPGWSVATIYYHTSVDAGGEVAFARQVTRGNLKVNFTGNVRAVLDADADIGFLSPELHLRVAGFWRAADRCHARRLRPVGGRRRCDADRRIGPHRFHGVGWRQRLGDRLRGPAPFCQSALERWGAQLHDLRRWQSSRSATTRRGAWPISASATPRWTAALATPTSTQRPATNSQPCWASLTISRTIIPTIRTASTCTSTGPPPSS